MSLDVYLMAVRETDVYSSNITHNLNTMADAAGLYNPLWRPDEVGITTAAQLIEPLRAGLSRPSLTASGRSTRRTAGATTRVWCGSWKSTSRHVKRTPMRK